MKIQKLSASRCVDTEIETARQDLDRLRSELWPGTDPAIIHQYLRQTTIISPSTDRCRAKGTKCEWQFRASQIDIVDHPAFGEDRGRRSELTVSVDWRA